MKNILSLFYFFFFLLLLFFLILLFLLFFFSLTGLVIEGWTKSDIIKLITHKLKLTMTNGNFVMYWILKHDWTTTVNLSRKIFYLTPFWIHRIHVFQVCWMYLLQVKTYDSNFIASSLMSTSKICINNGSHPITVLQTNQFPFLYGFMVKYDENQVHSGHLQKYIL